MNTGDTAKSDRAANRVRIIRIVQIALAVLMTLVGLAVLVYRYEFQKATGTEIVIISANAFEIALLAALFIQNRINKDNDAGRTETSGGNAGAGHYFGIVLLVMCFKIVMDQITYALDGRVGLIWANWIACSLTYLSSVPVMLFFWNYCGHQPGISEKTFITVNRIAIALGIIIGVILIINPFFHLVFYIDENGCFNLARGYGLLTLQNIFVSIICIIAILRARIAANRKIMLTVVFFTPIFGLVLSIISADLIFLQYLCMTLALFFCYVSVYIRDEDRLKSKMAELDTAAAIQRGALREDFGDFGDHKIYAYMKPAREVGGDFYDFFNVDEHTTGVLIADVSGKGIPAAMFMMQGLSAIRELAGQGCPINEVFENANDLLCAHNENEYFITAWMAYIDRQTGKVSYVNAGHNPPVLKKSDGTAEYIAGRPGLVLAAMEGITYRINEFEMGIGDTLFMYTDGITEAQTVKNELYGEERLIGLARSASADPGELTAAVLNSVNSFAGKAEQFDDMTIICYGRKQ